MQRGNSRTAEADAKSLENLLPGFHFNTHHNHPQSTLITINIKKKTYNITEAAYHMNK